MDFATNAHIFINPTISDISEALALSGNVLKSICDLSGNLYLWDGNVFEHQQIMDKYNIQERLHDNRYYKDHGGEQQILEYLDYWRTNIKGRCYVDSAWLS